MEALPTRLVIPLLPTAAIRTRIERLHVLVEIEGRSLVVATNLMASIRRDQLERRIGSLADHHDEIVAAIDFLRQGF